jgi:hypothetical protein
MGLNSTDPSNMTQLVYVDHASYYRSYQSHYNGKEWKSEWISLVEGQMYPIEARHIEYWGGDFMTVSVEVEQTAIIGHPHSTKEVQFVEVRGSD